MITIIIPTYNRPAHLNRLLSFFKDQQWGNPIIVADSSAEKNVIENRKILANYHDRLNCNHLIYDTTIHAYRKLAETFKQVSTPYQVICADDDFIVPSAIMECVEFLEANKDYSIAQGLYCRHNIQNRGIFGYQFMWEPGYVNVRSCEENDPEERLISFLSDYCINYYGVYRTSQARLIFEKIAGATVHALLGELTLAAMGIILGKQKLLPIFYGSKELGISVAQTFEKLPEIYSTIQFLIVESKPKYDQVLAVMTDQLRLHKKCNYEEANRCVSNAMQKYLATLKSHQPQLLGFKGLIKKIPKPAWYRLLRRAQYLNTIKKDYLVRFREVDKFRNIINKIRLAVLTHANDTNP